MCKDKGTKMEIYLSGCLTNCRGVRTICIQLNTRQCILLTLLPLFFLRPPPPSGHLASLTMALAWPTFLVLYVRTKKEKERKRTLTLTRLCGREYIVQVNTNLAFSPTAVNYVTMSTAVTVQ